MNEPTITCPNCKNDIKLSDSLAAPLLDSMRAQHQEKFDAMGQKFKKIIEEKECQMKEKEKELQEKRKDLVKAEQAINQRVYEQVKIEKEKIIADEAKKAKVLLMNDIEQKEKEIISLNEVLNDRSLKLEEAQNAQVELLRKERELDDAKREMDLTIEKRVSSALDTVREQAKKGAEEELKLKVSEKEQTILSMQRQIDELRKRSEQGSQQLQGEVFELELENHLRSNFSQDLIESVPKGEFGGDVFQRIINQVGKECGTILWESKRTKNWSDGWLSKLREDQRSAKADFALIISHVLPKGVESFSFIEGIWVTNQKCAIPLAIALRQSLIELANARLAGEGQQTKMEMVYQYLTGTRFRQRVQAIVEKFADMQEDLEKERKSTTRLWAKREQIRGVIEATAGMYGDLQGIAGKSFQEIEGLDIQLLEEDHEEVVF